MQRRSDIPLPARALRLDDIPIIAEKAIAILGRGTILDERIRRRRIAIASKWLEKRLRAVSTHRSGLVTSTQRQTVNRIRAELHATHALSDLIRVLPPQDKTADCEIDVSGMIRTLEITQNSDVASWHVDWSFPETTSDFAKTLVESNAAMLARWANVAVEKLHANLFPGHLELVRAVLEDSNTKMITVAVFGDSAVSAAATDYIALACDAVGNNPSAAELHIMGYYSVTVDDGCADHLVRLIRTSRRLMQIRISGFRMSPEVRRRLEQAVVADGVQLHLNTPSPARAEAPRQADDSDVPMDDGGDDGGGGGSGSYF